MLEKRLTVTPLLLAMFPKLKLCYFFTIPKLTLSDPTGIRIALTCKHKKQRHQIPDTEIDPKPGKHDTRVVTTLHLEQSKNTHPTR